MPTKASAVRAPGELLVRSGLTKSIDGRGTGEVNPHHLSGQLRGRFRGHLRVEIFKRSYRQGFIK